MSGQRRQILVSGASGFIGSALLPLLRTSSYDVVRLVRSRAAIIEDTRFWDPASGVIELPRTDLYEAVIHLAGVNIGERKLTQQRKREVWNSRTDGTTLLCEALTQLDSQPRVFVSASGMGIYGERGDERLTEASAPGEGFISDLVQAWEVAAEPARRAGIRVAHVRTSVVLSAAGGALRRMLLPFRLGVGGPLGSGKQWFSWITRDDLVRLYLHIVETPELSGPVNGAAPGVVRQREFAKTLGRELNRPALFPVPRSVLRIMFGKDLGDHLLESAHLVPEKALASGFVFHHPTLTEALPWVINDKP